MTDDHTAGHVRHLESGRMIGRTRSLEDTFVEACTRQAEFGRTFYVAVPPADNMLALTLRLRRLGYTVVTSDSLKPGVAMILSGLPCADCGMPVDDPSLKFCNDCRHRFAGGNV